VSPLPLISKALIPSVSGFVNADLAIIICLRLVNDELNVGSKSTSPKLTEAVEYELVVTDNDVSLIE